MHRAFLLVDTHAIDEGVGDQIIIVCELRQSQAAFLLQRSVQISRVRGHGRP